MMVVVVVVRMGGLQKILQESVCPGTWNQRARWSSPVGTHEYSCECVGAVRLQQATAVLGCTLDSITHLRHMEDGRTADGGHSSHLYI